jgi:hypothetical protein
VKYVMFKCVDDLMVVTYIPIIFPDTMVHKQVARQIASLLLRQHGFKLVQVVSAGDILLSAVACTGSSETLSSKSRGNVDDAIINSYPYFHGISLDD